MPTLLQHLEHMPFRELRAVVTRLDVRKQAGRDANDEWRRAINAFWQDDERAASLLAQLSVPAQSALTALASAESTLATHFFHEYGVIRRPGATTRSAPGPWLAPQSAAEELYYVGLLHAHTPVSIHRAQAVTLPDDLRSRLNRLKSRSSMAENALCTALLHDCAQVLVFLHQHAHLHLFHDRWLPLDALRVFNQRLLQPAPQPLVSHKQAEWPAFLFFLCAAAELVHQGHPTPIGWSWLEQSPSRQLLHLWQGWQAASLDLRTHYSRPAAHLPPPWPTLLVRLLGQQIAPFTAAELASRLLAAPAEFHPFFVAHFHDAQELTNAIAPMLSADLSLLGVIEPTRPTSPQQRFAVTQPGNWLLHPNADAPFGQANGGVAAVALRVVEQPHSWRINVPVALPGRPLALIAPYLRTLDVDATAQCHRIHLDAHSVARASASGHGLPALLTGLHDLRVTLTADQVKQLHTWHKAGQSLQILHLPILRASTKEQMKLLRAAPRLHHLFGELLSPTVSALHAPPAEVSRQLSQAGFHAATHEFFDEADAQEESAEVDESLWLAARLYALFSQHAKTPLPPPFTAMKKLWARLSGSQQVTLQGQWQQIEDEFHRIVEGLVANPPPTPSDPAQWRPLIERAIQEHGTLDLHYFSATRNLLTRRLVDPYWIEEGRWGPCLVGWCHITGRVLTFRLDRIQALGDGGVGGGRLAIENGE